MKATISGITAMDRMELEPELEAYGAEFKEDDATQHGQGDMGIFTIGVPLTMAVAGVLKAWIKSRTPITVIKIKKGEDEIIVNRRGKEISPAELKETCEAIDRISG